MTGWKLAFGGSVGIIELVTPVIDYKSFKIKLVE